MAFRKRQSRLPRSHVQGLLVDRGRDGLAAFALALLAFSGYVKGSPALGWLPVDITLVAAGLVAVLIVDRVLGGGGLPRGILLVSLLWLTFLFAIPDKSWSPEYATLKTRNVFTLVLLSVMGGMFLLRSRRALRAWLIASVVLGVLVGIISIVFPDPLAEAQGRFAAEGSNTIGAGRALGGAATVALAAAMGGVAKSGRAVLLGLALVTGMIAAGSRGPAIAAVAALGVVAVALGDRKRVKRVATVTAVGAFCAIAVVQLGLAPKRLFSSDESSDARMMLAGQALELIRQHPMGLDWGGFFGLLYVPDFALMPYVKYPHNILLEITGEAGWLSGILLVALLWVALARQFRAGLGVGGAAMFGLLLFLAISAMVSGDVNDNRGLWAMVGAGLASVPQKRAELEDC